MENPRIAVVATHSRPVELERLLRSIAPQCDAIIVIDNASGIPAAYLTRRLMLDRRGGGLAHIEVIRDEEQPPNLSRLWNVGLDRARDGVACFEGEPYDVAVLNDDAVPPPGWWDAVSDAMRTHSAAAASSCPFDSLAAGQTRVWFGDAPYGVTTRLAGWAFMLRGEQGLRLDERFRWWAGDDDLSARARDLGGIVHVGGYPVPNTGADTSTTGVLAEQAARDMQTFVDVHGRRPW